VAEDHSYGHDTVLPGELTDVEYKDWPWTPRIPWPHEHLFDKAGACACGHQDVREVKGTNDEP
jgi:hypothetical protein